MPVSVLPQAPIVACGPYSDSVEGYSAAVAAQRATAATQGAVRLSWSVAAVSRGDWFTDLRREKYSKVR